MFTKTEITKLNQTLQDSMTINKPKQMELSTPIVNSLLAMSDDAFQALVRNDVFPTNPYHSFDNSGIAEKGNAFDPSPCYFSKSGS